MVGYNDDNGPKQHRTHLGMRLVFLILAIDFYIRNMFYLCFDGTRKVGKRDDEQNSTSDLVFAVGHDYF